MVDAIEALPPIPASGIGGQDGHILYEKRLSRVVEVQERSDLLLLHYLQVGETSTEVYGKWESGYYQ